eukprot:1811201-Pleurochrysis_carterae.AAC.1
MPHKVLLISGFVGVSSHSYIAASSRPAYSTALIYLPTVPQLLALSARHTMAAGHPFSRPASAGCPDGLGVQSETASTFERQDPIMKAVEPASCTEAMRSNKEASPGSYGRVELINLKGSTVFISPSGQLVSTLRRDAALLQGVPLAALRLKSGGKELCDDDLIADVIAKGVPVRTALRLLGGKGGFGAMLRSAGKNGVKTTNFDACRDLNGRRLRH